MLCKGLSKHFVKVKLNTFQFEITCQCGPEGDTESEQRVKVDWLQNICYPGWPPPRGGDPLSLSGHLWGLWEQPHCGRRYRPHWVLHVSGVGHPGGSGQEKCQVLHLLWRAIPGHHLQHHHEEEDSLLHRQPHHPLHGHQLPHSPCLLPPVWQWREGRNVFNCIIFFLQKYPCRSVFQFPSFSPSLCSSCSSPRSSRPPPWSCLY